jgi:hypothetical protein
VRYLVGALVLIINAPDLEYMESLAVLFDHLNNSDKEDFLT